MVDAIERRRARRHPSRALEHLDERVLGAFRDRRARSRRLRGQAQQHVAPDADRRPLGRRGAGHRGDVGRPTGAVGARQAQQLVERLLRRRIFLHRLAPTSRTPRPDRPACARRSRRGRWNSAWRSATSVSFASCTSWIRCSFSHSSPLSVERLEHVGDLELHVPPMEHALERGARLVVGRVGGQDLAVGLDRPCRSTERQLVDLRRAGSCSATRSRRRCARAGSRGAGSRPARATAARLRVQPIERDQRRACCRARPRGRGGRSRSPRRAVRAPPRRRARGAGAGRPGAARVRRLARSRPRSSVASLAQCPVSPARRSMWPSTSWLPESSRSARA